MFLQNVVCLRDCVSTITIIASVISIKIYCVIFLLLFSSIFCSVLCVYNYSLFYPFTCQFSTFYLFISISLASQFICVKTLGANPCSGMIIGFEILCFLVYMFLWFPCYMQSNTYLCALELVLGIWGVFLCWTI